MTKSSRHCHEYEERTDALFGLSILGDSHQSGLSDKMAEKASRRKLVKRLSPISVKERDPAAMWSAVCVTIRKVLHDVKLPRVRCRRRFGAWQRALCCHQEWRPGT